MTKEKHLITRSAEIVELLAYISKEQQKKNVLDKATLLKGAVLLQKNKLIMKNINKFERLRLRNLLQVFWSEESELLKIFEEKGHSTL